MYNINKMSRSFTIVSIEKTGGAKVQYKDGRFMSSTPAGAASKMFSHANRHCRTKCNSFKIILRETTQGSNKKEYTYRVTKKKEETTVNLGKTEVTFGFTTKTKSLN
jgi:hypothetical protein